MKKCLSVADDNSIKHNPERHKIHVQVIHEALQYRAITGRKQNALNPWALKPSPSRQESVNEDGNGHRL